MDLNKINLSAYNGEEQKRKWRMKGKGKNKVKLKRGAFTRVAIFHKQKYRTSSLI